MNATNQIAKELVKIEGENKTLKSDMELKDKKLEE